MGSLFNKKGERMTLSRGLRLVQRNITAAWDVFFRTSPRNDRNTVAAADADYAGD